eukprot:SAG31_NODE_17851_length_655_cov_2.633094_2_plen_44_part_01
MHAREHLLKLRILIMRICALVIFVYYSVGIGSTPLPSSLDLWYN